MKVIRFMTSTEFNEYMSGKTTYNFRHHSDGNASTSVGFCFAELTSVRDANKWLRKLFALHQCEWCLEFDTEQCEPLTESKAIYCSDDIDEMTQLKMIPIREWCCTSLSKRTHPFTRIGKCPTLIELIEGKGITWVEVQGNDITRDI